MKKFNLALVHALRYFATQFDFVALDKQEARTFLGGLGALVEHEPLVSAPAVIDLDEQSSSLASEVTVLNEEPSSPASDVIVLDEESLVSVLDVVDLDEGALFP
ncbi:hypothetical protein TKK_0002378 [Trichogramma kaykai]